MLLRSGKKQVIKWTAEGAVKCDFYYRVFCNERACVSCRGYVSILLSVWEVPQNQGGTADKILFVLDRRLNSVKGVFYLFG